MKNIAVLLNKLEENNFTSGGEKVNSLIIKALKQSGFNVDVFCKETALTSSEFIDNIYLNQSDLLQKRIEQNYYITTFSENFAYAKMLYVHENTRIFRDTEGSSHLDRLIKNIFKRKRVADQKRWSGMQKTAAESAEKLFVPSSFIKNDLIKNMGVVPERIYIVSPPVDLPGEGEAQKSSEFTFGLVARSFDLKGGYEFLFALGLLKLMRQKFKVKMVIKQNPNSSKLSVIEMIIKILNLSKNVEIIEYGTKIEDFYASIDCLVMPSKREAFGLVGAEAMSLSLPVITNTRCGLQDYIKDGENGFVYKFGGSKILPLYKKLAYVLKNKDNLQKIKENAKRTSQEFSFEIFKEKLVRAIGL